MLSAYYTKSVDSKYIFDKLNISKCTSYMENLNKYNVIKIDFSELSNERCSYEEYINMIKSTIIKDIESAYKEVDIKSADNIPRILEETNDKFIFIFDEWDFIFNRGLFEDKSYVALAYMTAKGIKVYNPRSVVLALANDYCQSYWTNTGAMDEVLEYLKYNVHEVREDVIRMVDGELVRVNIREEFRAGQGKPKNKVEIYSAMIVLGFLSYYNNRLKIPNKELMFEFENALSNESFGEVSEIIKNSDKLLEATVQGDADKVAQMLHYVHNSEIPVLKYNDENSLSCVVTLAYLTARNTYRIEREEKSGKGYIDFSFHPRYEGDTPFIVELKKDEGVDVALNQIKEKEYYVKFKKEYKDRNILLVAICYDSKTKEHSCKIEKI